ncbi:protein tesmin/TSO1-like CXC 2 [Macadamia integrifolia]|uniref:protein tesmin/TSO1-like CXC 2 n=1 Tax=Macadamia integrifolia TaxID=60698 RepID=UPI001C4FE0B9|nr:protein tesmin/TSO1-like CXC 2 [Macadamia integrifolia]
MDTPDRNQIGTPISKFEDSPVFRYINNLSPIKPVKPIHIAQTFNSLTFASVPSVFTSPHSISHKECRILRRHHLSDLSKPDFSGNGNEGNTGIGVLDSVQLPDCSAQQESFDLGSSVTEVTLPSNESPNLAIELPSNLKYDYGSPDCNPLPSHGIEMDPLPEITATPASLVHFVQEVSEERQHPFESKEEIQGVCQVDQNKEERAVCNWENLISDASDLLIFDASVDAGAPKEQSLDLVHHEIGSFASLGSKLPQGSTDDSQKTQPMGLVETCEEHEMEDTESRSEAVREQKEMDKILHVSSSSFSSKQMNSGPSEGIDETAEKYISVSGKPDSQHQRVMRRRCLVFEMAGAQKKNLVDDSKSSSSVSSLSDVKASDDKQLVPIKHENTSSPCILPAIGLHLNALAATSKDCGVKHETLDSGGQIICMRSSITSFHSIVSGQITLTKSLGLNSMGGEISPADNGSLAVQDASQASTFGANEEFNSSSPKKKRLKFENVGESQACKRCNCKKSKCLKLYCECFAAGVYCVEPCSCLECFNKPIHEDTVLATRKQIEFRNPLAFAPKVIRSSEPVLEIGDDSNRTPASARHKRGCNCKKSSCLKKYCECFQGGVGCSINCRCEGCKNTFGRKDVFAPLRIEEAEPEEEETETCENNGLDRSVHNNEVHKDEVKYSDSVLPITPSFQICRPLVLLPCSSSGKPPRPVPVGSSPRLHSSWRLGKSDSVQPQSKFERHCETMTDDETPEILRGDCSPISGIKTLSPNCKRVSPPHNEFGMSPGRRSGRKLILQSIPSFPSLTSHHETNDFPLKLE